MTIKYDLIQQFHEKKNIYYKFQVPICEKFLASVVYVFFHIVLFINVKLIKGVDDHLTSWLYMRVRT